MSPATFWMKFSPHIRVGDPQIGHSYMLQYVKTPLGLTIDDKTATHVTWLHCRYVALFTLSNNVNCNRCLLTRSQQLQTKIHSYKMCDIIEMWLCSIILYRLLVLIGCKRKENVSRKITMKHWFHHIVAGRFGKSARWFTRGNIAINKISKQIFYLQLFIFPCTYSNIVHALVNVSYNVVKCLNNNLHFIWPHLVSENCDLNTACFF